MKKKFFSAIAVIAYCLVVIGLASCSNDYDPTYLSEVRVSQSYIGFAAEGSTATIEVNATADWVITNVPEWVTVSPTSGSAGKTDVTFTTVQTTATNEATVILECGGATQRINLIQMTKKAEAQLATCAQIAAGNEGATYRVRGVCATNPDNQYGNWNIKDETGQIYIYGTLDKKGGKGTYPISGTNGWGFGVGDIVTVEGPMKNYNGTIELVDVTVISIEKSLIKVDGLSTTDALPAEGGEVTAFISCKGNGVGIIIADDAKSWLSISGLTPGSVTFTAAPNEGDFRKADVTFTTVDDQGNEYTTQTTISQQAKPNAAGSEANPFTVAEAIAKCQEVGGTATDQLFYAKGRISSIKEVSTSYGNATFNISDDGQDENYVTCFRAYSLGGEKFTAEDEISVGDEVLICGKLVNYTDKNGVTTPQFAQGCYIVSIRKGNAAGSLTKPFTPAEANAFCQALGEGNTTTDDYYVKGKIIEITDSNQFGTKYGNCTFYLSADGTDSGEKFYVFRTLYLGNQKYTDDSWLKPKAGDEVIICGKFTLYKDKDGNLVPETSANNSYIYSLNGKTE